MVVVGGVTTVGSGGEDDTTMILMKHSRFKKTKTKKKNEVESEQAGQGGACCGNSLNDTFCKCKKSIPSKYSTRSWSAAAAAMEMKWWKSVEGRTEIATVTALSTRLQYYDRTETELMLVLMYRAWTEKKKRSIASNQRPDPRTYFSSSITAGFVPRMSASVNDNNSVDRVPSHLL